VLNGTTYTIKPGYAQTFEEDRVWTIEFLRGGNRSPVMRYALKAGTYQFEFDENGWDLRLPPGDSVPPPPSPTPIVLPPPPSESLAPIPSGDL
jgi:hypothetical protein